MWPASPTTSRTTTAWSIISSRSSKPGPPRSRRRNGLRPRPSKPPNSRNRSVAALKTLVSAWTGARRRLESAGIDSPVIDARLLVQAATGSSRTDIITDPHRALTPRQVDELESLLSRRERREPVSHILGVKGFWKIMLRVNGDVLTPRPETETILDVVLADFGESRPFRVLDLGV